MGNADEGRCFEITQRCGRAALAHDTPQERSSQRRENLGVDPLGCHEAMILEPRCHAPAELGSQQALDRDGRFHRQPRRREPLHARPTRASSLACAAEEPANSSTKQTRVAGTPCHLRPAGSLETVHATVSRTTPDTLHAEETPHPVG